MPTARGFRVGFEVTRDCESVTSGELKLSLIRLKNSTDRWLLITCYSENDLILNHSSEIILSKTNSITRNIETFGNGGSRAKSHTFRPFFLRLSCCVALEVLFHSTAVFVVNDALARQSVEYSPCDIWMRQKTASNNSAAHRILLPC